MNRWDKLFCLLCLIGSAIAAIGAVDKEFYALLAMLNLLIGVIIGMIILLPIGNKDKG
jgi:hypothetical protein